MWVLKKKQDSAAQSAYHKQQKSHKSSQSDDTGFLFDGTSTKYSTKFSDKEDPKYGHILVSTMVRKERYGYLEEKATLQSYNKLTPVFQQKLTDYRPIWITITQKELVKYLDQDYDEDERPALLDYCRGLSPNYAQAERIFYCADESPDELNLTRLNFSGTDLSHCVFNNCQFGGSLKGSKWSHSYLREADFSQVTSAEGADFNNAHLEGLKASQINFSHCDFTQAQFHYANLSGANLTHAKIIGAVWNHAILTGTETADWEKLNQTQKEQQASSLQQAESLHEISIAYNQQQQQIRDLQNDLKRFDLRTGQKIETGLEVAH